MLNPPRLRMQSDHADIWKRHFHLVLRIAAAFILFSEIAAAQNSVRVDFGIRGGILLNGYVPKPTCSGAGCVLGPTYSLVSETTRTTAGVSAAILYADRLELRFEALRWRFEFEEHFDRSSYPEEHIISTTRGHAWEYPLLLTYRFGRGPARPFAGAGIGLFGRTNSKVETLSMTMNPSPSGPPTIIRSESSTATSSSTGFYLVGGFEGQAGRYVSIRPELRYGNSPRNDRFGRILNPNQWEFLVGISFHPFQIK